MSAVDDLGAPLATLLPQLRAEFEDWTIHQSDSGRWLAIRGNVCIRAHDVVELRERIRRHLAETAEDFGGGQA